MTYAWRFRPVLLAFIGLFAGAMQTAGQQNEPLTPQSCTAIRYLATDAASSWKPALQESPDKTKVAYVVQIPNIVTNSNDTTLYVGRLDGNGTDNQKPVVTNHRIAAIQWLPDNEHLAALIEIHGKGALVDIDTKKESVENISDPAEDIADYSMDRAGNLFAVSTVMATQQVSGATTAEELAAGYRIKPLPPDFAGTGARREIHLIRRTPDGHWETGNRLDFRSPLTGKAMAPLGSHDGVAISLSPNGRYLLFDSVETPDGLPQSWYSDSYGSFMIKHVGFVIVSYLYDAVSGNISVPIETPIQRNQPVWSPDSSAYARISLPPVRSKWVTEDMQQDAPSYHNTHLFVVHVTTGKVEEVLHRAAQEPLVWTDTGQLIVRTGDGLIRSFESNDGKWVEKSRVRIPLQGLPPDGPLISNGSDFIGNYENASTAPQLFRYSKDNNNLKIIAKLDPEVAHYLLPQTEAVHWTTSTGYKADGVLLLPPDYSPARRYPLVIENGSFLYNGDFVCDSGIEHVSSFARGILADDGVLYLMRSSPDAANSERDYYPKGYPGQIAEAAFRMDVVDSAIKYLDSRKMIDLSRVGILGFSRGGWYTEFALVHSPFPVRAASVTDNVEYTMGDYWYYHSSFIMQEDDGVYGGPPYGKTLQNWLSYSISFNADKIHTPLLKEVMGYGLENENPDRLPANLALHYELFTALERLQKPVEMYYYPREEHQVEHPVARMVSLQRNIDWFRFWLQGYERQDPEDADQYKRWEQLRNEFESPEGAKRSAIESPDASTARAH